MKKKFKIGLALGGGAARALAHIGILEVFEKNDIAIDCISGTSMGAIIGGMYALGISPEMMKERATKMLPKAKKEILKKSYSSESIYSTKYIHKRLCEFFRGKTFDDLKMPFFPVSVDLIKGEKVIFTSGKIIDAVEASSRIPLIYPPKKIGGKVLVDGMVLCPVPTNVLKERCDFVISVAIAAYNKDKHPNHYLKMLNVFDRSLAILMNKVMHVELQNTKPDFLIFVDEVAKYEGEDYDKAGEIIEIGERMMQKKIRELKDKIKQEQNKNKIS